MKTKYFYLLLTILFSFNIQTKADPQSDLITAIKQGDLAGAEKAIAAGADVNLEAEDGSTPISTAIFWPEITQLLVDKGVDVNSGQYPAIISASNNYSVEVMKILFAAGADPNKPGMTDPGAFFRKKFEEEKAKGKKANKMLLNAYESNANSLKPGKVYAIDVTVQATNCVPCLKLLIDNGVDATKIDSATHTNILFTLAAFGMTPEMRKDGFSKAGPGMASYGLKVPDWYLNLPDEINGTSAQMAELLIKGGADMNLISSHDNRLNPLLTALGVRKVEVARALVDAGCDIKYVPKKNSKNAVDFAAEYGDLELLKSLVAKGGDLNNETWDLDKQTGSYCKGFTPLTRAAIYNNLECAQYLIDNGAKIKEGVSGYFSQEARAMFGKGKLLTNMSGQQLYCRYKLKNKMAIYYAIENDNLLMVELLANSFGWYQNHSMEMKAQTGSMDNTGALKGSCLAAGGKFTPSKYAKTLKNKEIYSYLTSKGK